MEPRAKDTHRREGRKSNEKQHNKQEVTGDSVEAREEEQRPRGWGGGDEQMVCSA